MGGADTVLTEGREAFGRGECRWVAQLVNAGTIAIDGDAGALIELIGLLEQPDLEFDIVTP